MSMGIIGNAVMATCLESHGPAMFIRQNLVGCGHCREVVYPDLLVLRNHDIRCESGVCIWYSRDLEIEVHRCRMPGAVVEESELLDLTAHALV